MCQPSIGRTSLTRYSVSVRELFPCRRCQRHVGSSESVCPFCHASPFLLPLIAALALGLPGCNKKSAHQQAEARAEAEQQAQMEEQKRHIEEQQRLAEKKRLELERSADIYGGPPLIPDAGRPDAAAKTCNCAPGDPLCSCL